MLDTFRRLSAAVELSVTAQPSAGLPILREGQTAYPVPPEELGAAAAQFIQMGARVVGGCCGTTGEHIAAIRRTVNRLAATKESKQAAPAGG